MSSITPLSQTKRVPSEVAILDALPLLVVHGAASGEMVALSKAAQEFFGSKPQALPEVLRALIGRGEAVTAHDVSLMRNLQEYRATVHMVPVEDGWLFTLDLKGSPHAPSASAWKQEITQAAGVMAAMLAHEVKNPLSSIRGAAQLLRETVSESERPLVELIGAETLRIRDLVDQMEVFSDARLPECSLLNIHEVLQYAVQVARTGFASSVTFIEKYDPSLPEVMSHRETLVQIFLNIIKNAAEAMAEVATPTITLTTAYQHTVRLAERKLPVMVKIEDNGKGISEEIRKKLFEPLMSTKEKGRGLGLSVVAKLASDLGMMVECDERKELGAGFTLYLPTK